MLKPPLYWIEWEAFVYTQETQLLLLLLFEFARTTKAAQTT